MCTWWSRHADDNLMVQWGPVWYLVIPKDDTRRIEAVPESTTTTTYLYVAGHPLLNRRRTRLVSGQFRCARYKCGISACKQSNLCCDDGFCTNLCCTNDIVHTYGTPRTKQGHLGGLKAESDKLQKNMTRKPRK